MEPTVRPCPHCASRGGKQNAGRHPHGRGAQLGQAADDPARVPAEFWIGETRPRISVDRPTVFRIYEQNIGPLTPLIADQLIKALETYPVGWIESALEEAVAYNRRSWRYVSRILENWTVDGPPGRTGNR